MDAIKVWDPAKGLSFGLPYSYSYTHQKDAIRCIALISFYIHLLAKFNLIISKSTCDDKRETYRPLEAVAPTQTITMLRLNTKSGSGMHFWIKKFKYCSLKIKEQLGKI